MWSSDDDNNFKMISRLNFNSEEKREVKTGIALESGEDYFQAITFKLDWDLVKGNTFPPSSS